MVQNVTQVNTVTTAPPPSRDTLHAQIVSNAPPAKQAEVARSLANIAPVLDSIIAATGLPLTLAVGAYTPMPFPRMRTKGTQQAISTDAASDAVLTGQGFV